MLYNTFCIAKGQKNPLTVTNCKLKLPQAVFIPSTGLNVEKPEQVKEPLTRKKTPKDWTVT